MLVKPFRLKLASRYLPSDRMTVLDVGAGSHSPTITKKWLPGCHYTGIDIVKSYNNDEQDLKAMDAFIEMDLTMLDFSRMQDDHFDLIIMSHVIEHLHNGDRVIEGLIKKLKPGGLIYLEFPSERSVHFPSQKETLNFYDDPTHVRIFSVREVTTILSRKGFNILSSGTRRQIINILLMPLKIVYQKLTLGYVRGGVYWDFYGFAEYVFAQRKK